jgi:hypothetical protein
LITNLTPNAAYNPFNAKNPNSTTAITKEQERIYTYLLSFYERRKTYNKLLQAKGPRLAGTIPEFLFYMVLGRADLIKFNPGQEDETMFKLLYAELEELKLEEADSDSLQGAVIELVRL